MSSVLSVEASVCPLTGFDHIEIEHDGKITWAEMQAVKNEHWGDDAVAFEMLPPQEFVINGNSTEFHFRHIWRWPENVDWPNMRKNGTW